MIENYKLNINRYLEYRYGYGFNGQEKVGNGSRWYNYNLRMYNPSIGRFNTIDPASQFNSPYLAMADNPMLYRPHRRQSRANPITANGDTKALIF